MSPESRILRSALALLSKKGGWGQGESVSGSRHCAVTAMWAGRSISVYAFASVVRTLVAAARCRNIRDDSDVGYMSRLIVWNDDAKRTKRDVLAAFRRAIKMAEGKA